MATVADLKEQLAKAERQLASAKEKDEVDFATKKVNRIKKELEELEKSGGGEKPAATTSKAKTEKPAAKKEEKAKPATKKAEKKERKSKYADLPSCDELQEAFLKRREQREKSQKKYKTKSAVNRAAGNLATATKQVAKDIEVPDNKKEANTVISKIEKLKTHIMAAVDLMEELSGDETTKKEVHEILAPLDEKLKKIRQENKA